MPIPLIVTHLKKTSCRGGSAMDIVYLGVIAALFLVSWLFMKLTKKV